MSTIYLIDRESSVGSNNLAAGDLFLIYDTSAKAIRNATGTNIQELTATGATAGTTTASKAIVPNASNKIDKIDVTTTALVGGFATSLVGFFGATVTTQPSATTQAAPASTASTSTTPWGYSTSVQATSIMNCVIQIQTALVALGLIKGSA